MNTEKVTEIFIGAGAAFDVNNTAMQSITGQLAIVGGDMTTLNPAGGDTITTQPIIYLVNKLANGDLKRSFPIKGTSVTSYNAESYKPSARNVWAIGYDRKLATGSIEVNCDTEYEFTIVFKNDKWMFSQRQEVLRATFTSASNATQLSIATQIRNAINNSAYGSQPVGIKEVKAVLVGDGTGAFGLTGATDYGVEIVGLTTVNQFSNTTYTDNLVYFSVQVNDATGFGSTTCTEIQALVRGTGTYNQIFNMENKFYGYEGVLNRRLWPIPVLAYLTNATPVTSGIIAAFTSATVTGEDVVTFSAAASTQLPAGSLVTLDAIAYEIEYYISSTVAVLTEVATTTNATGVVHGKAFYDVVNIEVSDVTTLDGAGVGQFSIKWVVIASPAINTAAVSMLTASPGSQDIMDILNGWMTTTPLAPANISI